MASPDDLVLKGDAKCTGCHDEADDPRPTMLELHPSVLAIGKTQPVTEDCSICHQPHGTNTENLLKARAPVLCQECHSHDSHPGQAMALPVASGNSTSLVGTVGRACMNCHTNIHGGNSTVNRATAGRFRR
jgi:predicted CXXCH cytochrome family protein